MIAFLQGKILHADSSSIILATHGVGYLVFLTKQELHSISVNSDISLFIYTNVKEDSIELFGFRDLKEKLAFQMLTSVSGIGPKIALNILSSLPLESLITAILHKDLASLCAIPGIGKKSAERMVLELKEKALKLEPASATIQQHSGNLINLQLAIKSLGYSRDQCEKAIRKLNQKDLEDLALDDLIKKTLSIMMSREVV